MTRDSGAERPTFEEVLAETWQRWEDIGHVINDVQRALGEIQSIYQEIDRSAAEAAADAGAAQAA